MWLCHGSLCYQQPLVEHVDPERLWWPSRKTEVSSWREGIPTAMSLSTTTRSPTRPRALACNETLDLRGSSGAAEAEGVGAGLYPLLQLHVSWALETFLQPTPLLEALSHSFGPSLNHNATFLVVICLLPSASSTGYRAYVCFTWAGTLLFLQSMKG